MTTACLAGRTAPGELLRLVADGLAGAGLDVRPPADADGRLDIALPGARCTLAVGEGGSAEWEYWPWSPDDADPDLTADLATVLLTGRSGPQPRLASGHQRENVTFKGIVGLELKARGLDVELAVYRDETAFDTFAEIVVTVPGPGDVGGQVCVADDGANMIVVAPGANGHLRPQHVEQAEALIRDAAAVIVQLETPPETVKAALEIARRHAVLSVLNPAPVDARALALAPLADLMTPNEIELERLTGVAGQDDAALREGLGRLIAAGAGRALATLGRNGAAALIDGELIRVPAFAVAAVDAVGAGDVYNAALVSRLVSGDPLPAAMRFAAAAAAISVTRPGADCAPSPAEVAAFLAKV